MKVGIDVSTKKSLEALDVSTEIMAYANTLAAGKSALFTLAASFFDVNDDTSILDYIDALDPKILLPQGSRIQRGEYGIYVSCAVWPFLGRNLKRYLELREVPFRFRREHEIVGLNQWKDLIRRVKDAESLFDTASTNWIAEDLELKRILNVFRSIKERLSQIEVQKTG